MKHKATNCELQTWNNFFNLDLGMEAPHAETTYWLEPWTQIKTETENER